MENYVFLDSENIVINYAVFDKENATDQIISTVSDSLGASLVILLGPDNPINTVLSLENYYGFPDLGNVWDGVDTFRRPKPGDNYILDINNVDWVELI